MGVNIYCPPGFISGFWAPTKRNQIRWIQGQKKLIERISHNLRTQGCRNRFMWRWRTLHSRHRDTVVTTADCRAQGQCRQQRRVACTSIPHVVTVLSVPREIRCGHLLPPPSAGWTPHSPHFLVSSRVSSKTHVLGPTCKWSRETSLEPLWRREGSVSWSGDELLHRQGLHALKQL